jgi:acyl carrier protein
MSVKDKVILIIAEQGLLDVADVSLSATLEDLGIDSLGVVESIFAIEEEFDIEVPLMQMRQRKVNLISPLWRPLFLRLKP